MSIPWTIARSITCAAILVGLFTAPALSRSLSDDGAIPDDSSGLASNTSMIEAIASRPSSKKPITLSASDLVRAARSVYCRQAICGPAPQSDAPTAFSGNAPSRFVEPDVVKLERQVSANVDVGLLCPPSLVTATIHW
jgi:hypothetical protein